MKQHNLIFVSVLLVCPSCISRPEQPSAATPDVYECVNTDGRYAPDKYASALEQKMIEAAFNGKLDVVKSCIAEGARIDTRYGGDSQYFKLSDGGWPRAGHNWTALMAAVENDRFLVASFLIENGANVRMHDGWGGTPLYSLAEKRKHRDEYVALARQLIKAGADVNAKTGVYIDGPSDTTVLHRAVCWGHTELVKMLIQNGANVNAKTSNGDTPMQYLYKGRNDEVIRKILLEAGAK